MGLEARIPCPACGGPIHPVAGRCKHCKTDLAAWHTGKPQVTSALPSLGNRTTNERAVSGPPSPGRRSTARPVLPLGDPATATFGMGSPLPSSGLPEARPRSEEPVAWPVIAIAISAVAIILSVGVLAAQLR
jgi:anti-sigma factor RsiW